MFDLLLDKKEKMYEKTGYRGKITIDDFEEYFFSNDSFFKKEDYYRHWLKSVDLLFKYSKAFFLTDVHDPNNADYCTTWVCHLLNNVVYFQENILLDEGYCLRDVIYSSVEIDDIEFTTDTGNKISTWQTAVRSINDFKKRLEKRLAKK